MKILILYSVESAQRARAKNCVLCVLSSEKLLNFHTYCDDLEFGVGELGILEGARPPPSGASLGVFAARKTPAPPKVGVGWVWGWVCVPKSVSFVANKASEYVTVNARWAEQSMAMAPIMKRHVSNFCRKSMRNL